MIKVLITMPHIFSPKKGSLYSSQNENKRETKKKGIQQASYGNMIRHSQEHWIHASLGYKKKIVTRSQKTRERVEVTIQIYTKAGHCLVNEIKSDEKIQIIEYNNIKDENIPAIASRRALEQSEDYDLICYIEDDILIEDYEFFEKINFLHSIVPPEYALMPHRCEMMQNTGYVILSGDPDEERKDLFWATGEKIAINWPTGLKEFYRATNPHSGCYFLSKKQAMKVHTYWKKNEWRSNFVLSGPLEQAASGVLLPVLKVMKPVPEDFKFLMVKHEDELWRRHEFEQSEYK